MDTLLEEVRLEHVERGGQYTWADLLEMYPQFKTVDTLRKRVQRYEKRFYGVINPEKINASSLADFSDKPGLHQNLRVPNRKHFINRNPLLTKPQYKQRTYHAEKPVGPDDTLQYGAEARIRALEEQVRQLIALLRHEKEYDDGEETLYVLDGIYDDSPQWYEFVTKLAGAKNTGVVAILSDVHFPDECKQAIELSLQIIKLLQPDVVDLNGDLFDLDTLSSFSTSRKRIQRDTIDESQDRYREFIGRIKTTCPKSIIIAKRGNHEKRLDTYMDNNHVPFANTIEASFIDMIRCDGQVLWMGDKQETQFGPLFIQHGKRIGENAAKMAAKDQGWSTPTVQGHSHRPGKYIGRVNVPGNVKSYRVVTSVVSGCLCNIPPHYQRDSDYTHWLHGIAVAHVNLNGMDANVQDIIFHRKPNGIMWAVVGNEIFEQSPI